MSHRNHALVPLLASLVLLPVLDAQAPPVTFMLLGGLSTGPNSYSRPLGISDDGTAVIGYSPSSTGMVHAFRWTASLGMVDLGVTPNADYSSGPATDATGTVVVGASGSHFWSWEEAFRHTPAGPMQSLGWLQGDTWSNAMGVNGNGDFIVGASAGPNGETPVRWNLGVISTLPQLSAGAPSYANCIDDTGQHIAGMEYVGANRHAVRWENNSIFDLGTLPGFAASEAIDISRDGAVIVGQSGHVFRWENHVMVDLGQPQNANYPEVRCANADCTMIGGVSHTLPNQVRAELWVKGRGWIELPQLLQQLGVNLGGESLMEINGISADGMVIVGQTATAQTFVLRNLPVNGFEVRPTGCGPGIDILHSGRPDRGRTFYIGVTASGTKFMLLGVPVTQPFAQCPGCTIGVDGSTFFGGTQIITVPQQPWLVGLVFAFQGFAFGGYPPNPCLNMVKFSDTVNVTIQ